MTFPKGAQGFQNPILGGDGTLLRVVMKSNDYVAGTSGWAIYSDGSAEFNNIIARGTIIGALFETAATGKRIVIDGTNPAFYSTITFYSGDPAEISPGVIQSQSVGGQPELSFQGPSAGLSAQAGLVILNDNGVDVSGDNIVFEGELSLTVGNFVMHAGDFNLDAGCHIKRGGLSAPTLVNGWTNFGGGFATARYIELPDNHGQISGVIKPGTTANGTIMFTMPAQMAPLSAHTFQAACGNGATGQVIVGADSTVKINNVTGTPTFVSLSSMRWPLF